MERWSNLPSQSGVYILRLDQRTDNNDTPESTFTLWLSDFKALWNETVTSENLFKRFSEKNPTLAQNDDVIQTEFITALGSVTNIKHSNICDESADNDDDMALQLKYLIFDDVEVEFQWLLKKCGPQEFFDQVTKPLLRQIGELQHQKAQLIDIAKRKDDEIFLYKSGQNVIHKRFITEKFEEQSFQLKSQMFNCEIDQFQSVIGLLPKNVVSNEPANDDSSNTAEQSIQNTSTMKYTSPKTNRNQRRPFRRPLIRPGQWKYEEDEEDDDDDGSEKRTRRST